jgi:predicted nucleic acid-binding protein
MKPEPNPAVRVWLNNQAAETLYLSSVTLAELLFGIGVLPTGTRKKMLAQTLDGLMGLLRDRVLPYDTDAACRTQVNVDRLPRRQCPQRARHWRR